MNHPESELIVRAVDVGFGNTKGTSASSGRGFGCFHFPSIAPLSKERLAVETGSRNVDLVEIKVGDAIYACGNDVTRFVEPTAQRILNPAYSKSDMYKALLATALYKIQRSKVDLLILGLPVDDYNAYRHALRRSMARGHEVPNWHLSKANPGGPATICVQVERVRVLPQPMGAFYNYSLNAGKYDEMLDSTNLVIDVGFGTLDWYTTEGIEPVEALCGSVFGGVSKIVRTVAEAARIGTEYFRRLELIDEALRGTRDRKGILNMGGKTIDLYQQHGSIIRNAVYDSLQNMVNQIKDFDTIQTIVLTGGGSHLFYPVLKEILGDREIQMDNEPLVSNVKGFQLVGEYWATNIQE